MGLWEGEVWNIPKRMNRKYTHCTGSVWAKRKQVGVAEEQCTRRRVETDQSLEGV